MQSKPYDPITTCNKQPALAQIVSHLIFTLETIAFFSVVLPHLEDPSKAVLTVLYCVSLVVIVVFTLICSVSDPSDEVMVFYRNHSHLE